MDITQYLLIGVVGILTTLLIVVGIQVFLILNDARRALQKTNKILEGESTFGKIVNVLTKQKTSQTEQKRQKSLLKKSITTQEILKSKSSYTPKSARVFRRAGRALTS